MFCIRIFFLAVLLLNAAATESYAYPVDGYSDTGIRRLNRLEKLMPEPSRRKKVLPEGAWGSIRDIRLRLRDRQDVGPDRLPPSDPVMQKKIDGLFPDRDASYSLALLDMTPGRPIRCAYRQADRSFMVGSVGKIAVAAGLFAELQRLYPDDVGKRQALMKNRLVQAGPWIHYDHHDVPVYDPDTGGYESRRIREGDVFSLYEWTDHMLSASANAAASTIWKELILMRKMGRAYPPDPQAEKDFFRSIGRAELVKIAMAVVNDPLQSIGMNPGDFHLGSLFTSYGKKTIPGHGNSRATPRGLMRLLIALEQGKLVDEWSSIEIKRLLYMTAKRIRYAASPALNPAMVFFKSGSLYKCRPEPDFACGKYRGNVENVMNSVAIVEHPGGRMYLVVLMSNVLKKNSAVEHQSLATFIDRIVGQTGGSSD